MLRFARAPLTGLAFALAFFAPGAAAAAQEGVRFTEAEFVFAREALTPPANLPWARVTLPDRWRENWMGITGNVWYRIRFQVDKHEGESWMVYLPRLREGGAIFVNGQLLATVRSPDAQSYVRWMRPHAFLIAPAQLRPGENQLHVRIDVTSEDKTMSSVYVGPEAVVRPLYESRLFWTYTVAQITVFITLAVAAFVLAIWIRRRMAFDYGLFGLASLFWGLHTTNNVIEILPYWLWMPWRVLRYTATGGFVVVLTLFMLRFARLRWRWMERLLLAYWPSGPLLLLIGGMGWQHAVDRYYQGGLVVIGTVMLGVTLAAGWRLRTPGSLALCAAVLVSIAFAVHDYLLSQGWSDPEQPFLLFYGADALLVVVGVLLADRFTRSLGEVEQANATLAEKVSLKERELAANYEQLRGYERERAVVDERQRIMQDMHDGLGSQLLTSLAAAERGALDPKGVAQVLREAIDDMRLAIDTLSPGRDGLLEALGNLRYRLEPRFRAAGVDLRFTYRNLPDVLDVPQEAALQILRVLQESLTNVLKHARAQRVNVEVAMDSEPRRFTLVVADDGGGFDASASAAAPARGRGLSGLRRRAAQMGATLDIGSDARGTRVTLAYPLPEIPAKAAAS